MPKITSASLASKQLPSANLFPLVELSDRLPKLADLSLNDKSSLISHRVVTGLSRFSDFAVICTLGFVIAWLYVADAQIGTAYTYPLAVFATAAATLAAFEFLGLYQVHNFTKVLAQMPRVFFGWTIAFCILIASLFFFKAGIEYSRIWLASWYVTGGIALIAARLTLGSFASQWKKQGRLFRRAAVVGTGPVLDKVLQQLETDPDGDIRIVGIFDDRQDERAADAVNGYINRGTLKDLINSARSTRIDLIILALPLSAEKRLASTIKKLSVLPADIKVPSSATELQFSSRIYSRLGPVRMIDVHDKPITDWGSLTKWAFDKAVSATALFLLSPVMLAIAAAIKFDSRGPVFFCQKRYGFNNEPIDVFKFRSMHTNLCDARAEKLVTRNDPRVTRVGQFIRKTSLDELPQLFNVLRGELSLVGPRPHAMQAKADNRLYDEVVEGYFARHKVKPGITGWAQINGWRGETDTEEKIEKRVEHDLYYIENWSLFLDLYILLKTPIALLKTENAY